MTNAFDLNDIAAYGAWRAAKLDHYPTSIEAMTVPVADPRNPTPDEVNRLVALCRKTNWAIYQSALNDRRDRTLPISLGAHLGLTKPDKSLTTEDDGVTELTVADEGSRRAYVPYSNRPMGWHTDGCYRDQDHKVHGFLLHCVNPAEVGGDSFLMDPDIAYIMLRDENPDFIAGLMEPDALTIPANIENGVTIRPEHSGPVFSIDRKYDCLHMRYTARKTNVIWRDDPRVKVAIQYLENLLAKPSPYIFKTRLEAGEGLIGNNVLHGRTGFQDSQRNDQKRLIYRVYFLDRINRKEHAA